jgi:hypothetical protein
MERRFNVFNLTRVEPNDGAGLRGGLTLTSVKLSASHDPEVDTETQSPSVGSYALAENFQRWYRTSEVTEIVSETDHEDHVEIIFKTLNSTYSLKKY